MTEFGRWSDAPARGADRPAHRPGGGDLACRYHVGITSVLRRCALAAGLAVLAVPAQAGMGARLVGYVEGCRLALASGDESGFADLAVETETTNETLRIRGWRGTAHRGLTVSLLLRINGEKRSGVCDVSFREPGSSAEMLADVSNASLGLSESLKARPEHLVEHKQAGEVVMTCDQGRGFAHFLDPNALGRGFAAQIALVPKSKMTCES